MMEGTNPEDYDNDMIGGDASAGVGDKLAQ